MNVGKSSQLEYYISPSDVTNKSVVWTSSNENVATVENGNVLAVGVGEAIITVTSNLTNKKDSVKVVVSDDTSVEPVGSYTHIEIVDDNGKVPAYNYYNASLTKYKNDVACTDDNDETKCFATDDDLASARGIRVLKEYDNKIFLGLGDYGSNSGKAELVYYDVATGEIETSV